MNINLRFPLLYSACILSTDIPFYSFLAGGSKCSTAMPYAPLEPALTITQRSGMSGRIRSE